MHNKIIIQKLLREGLLKEYSTKPLYGYHCTPCENVDTIMKNGFKIGSRHMQGEGVYAFYNLDNETIGYGTRHGGMDGFCIIKFVLTNSNRIFILNKEVAKEILGDDYDIVSQVIRIYGSMEAFIEKCVMLRPEFRTEEYVVNKLKSDFENKNPMGFTNIGSSDIIKSGMIYDGEYGLQYLIRRPQIMRPIGWYEYEVDGVGGGKLSELKQNNTFEELLKGDEYSDLRVAAKDNNIDSVDGLIQLRGMLDNKLYTVRNNREFNYYQNLIELINKIVRY
jgi:hypothetical protein